MASSSQQQTTSNVTITQIPCPPEDSYSLVDLQQRAQWLIANHTSLGKVCMAIAGGGGHALSTLAATSGASQLLLEGTVTYDRASFQNYVKRNLPNDKSFSYSSLEAARMASESALLQGMQLRARNADSEGNTTLWAIRDTVGLGSASTLKTTTQGGMSRTGRPSHGNIVATRSNGTQTCMHLTLNCPTQNRFQQDVFCSHMILQTLEELAQEKNKQKKGNNDNSPPPSESTVDPEEFEGVTIRQWMASEKSADTEEQSSLIEKAANRILSGEQKAVLLLPKPNVDSNSEGAFLEPLLYPVLPDNCLIMPGSFNPPHQGHVGLARAAVDKLSAMDGDGTALRPLVFELSITNADKPAMAAEEVARRVSLFRQVMMNSGNEDDEGIPQWGILLTSAPLFADKVRALQQYAPPVLSTDTNTSTSSRRWSFIIGTDTMVRVLNPKYYNHDYEQMLEAQRSMGAGFVVGGRVEQQQQQQPTNGSHGAKFVTGEEALVGLPQDVQDLFVLLGESDFRVDISSTELRAAAAAKANGQKAS